MVIPIFLVAALSAIATGASGSLPSDRVAVTAKIDTRDLDLRSDDGRRHFRARIASAAHQACGVCPKDLALAVDVMRCIRQMRADGARQLAALTGEPVEVVTPIEKSGQSPGDRPVVQGGRPTGEAVDSRYPQGERSSDHPRLGAHCCGWISLRLRISLFSRLEWRDDVDFANPAAARLAAPHPHRQSGRHRGRILRLLHLRDRGGAGVRRPVLPGDERHCAADAELRQLRHRLQALH